MNLIIPLIFSLIIGAIDGHASVVVAGVLITLACQLHLLFLKGDDLAHGKKLMTIVVPLYMVMALLFSFSFDSVNHFVVSDSSRYIQSCCYARVNLYDYSQLRDCYFAFADNNALYNSSLWYICVFANNHLGGSSVLFMTLIQTFFGIMSIMMLYRILIKQFGLEIGYKYSLLFACFSFFLFYSAVVIRDIVIVYFYLLSTYIIFERFKIKNIFLLLAIIFVVWGLRLYSGIFLFAFLGYYIYSQFIPEKYQKVSLLVFIPVLIFIAISALSSDLFIQSSEDLEELSELSNGNSGGGMVSKLMSLPPGLSQLALMLFAMIKPFPPFSMFVLSESFSNYVMSVVYTVNGVFWMSIFYIVVYGLIFKGFFKNTPFSEKLLLLIVLVFLLANTAHADIRRMMPVFPIIYIYYIRMALSRDASWMKQLRNAWLIVYFLLGLVIK